MNAFRSPEPDIVLNDDDVRDLIHLARIAPDRDYPTSVADLIVRCRALPASRPVKIRVI